MMTDTSRLQIDPNEDGSGRYSPRIRSMLIQINPYYYSCLYKKSFVQHVLDSLRDCENEFGLQPRQYTAPVEEKFGMEEREDGSDEDVEGGSATDDTSSGKAVSLSDVYLQEKSQKSLVELLYDKLHLAHPTPKQAHLDLSPWSSCRHAHFAELPASYVGKLKTMVVRSHRAASRGHQLITGHQSTPDTTGSQKRVGSGSGRQSLAAHSDPLLGSVQQQQHRTRSAGKERRPGLARPGSPTPPSPASPYLQNPSLRVISYKFQHHLKHSEYMAAYRAAYTDRNLMGQPSCSQVAAVSPAKEGHRIQTVEVSCHDVRDGASVQPVRLANYRFSTANASLRVKAVQPKNLGVVGHSPQRKDRVPPTSQEPRKVPSPLAGNRMTVGSAIVSRSRPSIPSNARGVICDTAIETPTHTVHVPCKQVQPCNKMSPTENVTTIAALKQRIDTAIKGQTRTKSRRKFCYSGSTHSIPPR